MYDRFHQPLICIHVLHVLPSPPTIDPLPFNASIVAITKAPQSVAGAQERRGGSHRQRGSPRSINRKLPLKTIIVSVWWDFSPCVFMFDLKYWISVPPRTHAASVSANGHGPRRRSPLRGFSFSPSHSETLPGSITILPVLPHETQLPRSLSFSKPNTAQTQPNNLPNVTGIGTTTLRDWVDHREKGSGRPPPPVSDVHFIAVPRTRLLQCEWSQMSFFLQVTGMLTCRR